MADIELKSIHITSPFSGQVNPAFDGNEDVTKDPLPPDSVIQENGTNLTQHEYETLNNGRATSIQQKIDDENNDDDDDDDDEEDLEEDSDPNAYVKFVSKVQNSLREKWKNFSFYFWRIFWLVILAGYFAYFGYAMYYTKLENEASIRLLWVTSAVVFCIIVHYIWKYFGDGISEKCSPVTEFGSKHNEKISWAVVSVLIIFCLVFTIVDVFTNSENPYNLVSFAGIVVYLLIFYIFSYNPAKVKWRPVAWGLALQFVFALFILRWDRGYSAFQWLGDRVAEFLDHTAAGAAFAFGDNYKDHFFAFSVLPTVLFFSCVISALYYLGVMQFIIIKIAWFMQVTMGTTAGESLNAAGNIFIGQTEAPLLIRPLLRSMTASEIHAVMTGGFATVAGGVLAAYIGMGVPANHLISASVMSAPAALALAKLFYPETKKSKTSANQMTTLPKSESHNLVEAAAEGASSAISLVANIAANVIAFIAVLEFFNSTLTWFGHRVGVESLTLQFILSYVFWPFAFLMGVVPGDCRKVGTFIGVKMFLNEFIAYEDLGALISNKEAWKDHVITKNMSWAWDGDDVILSYPNGTESILTNGIMEDRSIAITTYALCGFANFGSIGIQLGALGAMAPSKKKTLARVAVRAMIAGTVADFLTACIAGLYYQGGDI